ncbi:hypothetical protein [Chamaesiphon sp. VAR_48_metabat_135_sub]|uniref:hypothetical protein n=1 Tax=Chamaesiphon sp. VAR_48_metabat_135_sub TaxID=2964699 RepID=UPI00286B2A73|nr:hypothetical protein [Chamaesiphon sp. VAR_48_metabat_135_sub]
MSKLNRIVIVSAIALLSLSGEVSIAKEGRQKTERKPNLECIADTARETIRDLINYPGAYESGYQQGTRTRMRSGNFQPPANGEFGRGYTDGYYLKPYAGQGTTVSTYNKVKCGCRTRILKDAVFDEEIEASCKVDREEIPSASSDAYNPSAYTDGYLEGIRSKTKRETYQARFAGGEFARGFEDGYFGRRSTGQRYTELPVKDYKCKCRLIIKHNDVDAAP